MKNYIKKLMMLSLLNIGTLALCMEEQQDKQNYQRKFEDPSLPDETWAQILEHVYLNPAILDEANDIYEGIDEIEGYIEKFHVIISVEDFKAIRKFYINHLNNKFLEKREGDEGLYPKGNEWISNTKINKAIALFISTQIVGENLHYVLDLNFLLSERKLIHLLLFYGFNPNNKNKKGFHPLILMFSQEGKKPNPKTIITFLKYGAHPNIQDRDGNTPLLKLLNNRHLKCAFKGENKILELINDLLKYNANPNTVNRNGFRALYYAVMNHDEKLRDYRKIITLLLQYGANPYIEDPKGETAFDIARECNFTELKQLVKIHSQNTLKKICLQYILTNLPLFEDQLDTLPIELRDIINNLKS